MENVQIDSSDEIYARRRAQRMTSNQLAAGSVAATDSATANVPSDKPRTAAEIFASRRLDVQRARSRSVG